MLGADFLFRVGSLIRLGPSLSFTFPQTVKTDPDGVDFEVGSDLDLDFVIEVAPRVGPNVWLVPRAEVGGMVFFPTGDEKDALDFEKTQCESSSGLSGCDGIGGPRPGLNGGLSFGALFKVGAAVRLRADLLAQLYIINLATHDENDVGSRTISENVGGSRFFLRGGIEF